MGIKKLLIVLRERCKEIVQTVDLSEMKGHKIAIDIAVLTYAYKSQYTSNVAPKLDLIYNDIDQEACSLYMMKQVLKLYSHMLIASTLPITVFDGPAPVLKNGTKKDRAAKAEKKRDRIATLRRIARSLLEIKNYDLPREDVEFLQSFKKPISTIDQLRSRLLTEIKAYIVITPEDRFRLATIFTNLGLPHLEAESEAEQTCAQMARQRDVLAVYTVDSDCLVYGCPIMINKLSYMSTVTIPVPPKAQCYSFVNVLTVMELTNVQFIDFCIMCGTDFNPNPPGFGPENNLTLLRCYGSIPKIIKAKEIVLEKLKRMPFSALSKEENLLAMFDHTVLNYDEVRCFFTRPVKYDKNALNIKLRENQFDRAFEALDTFLGTAVFAEIMDVSKKIVERLQSLSKFLKV